MLLWLHGRARPRNKTPCKKAWQEQSMFYYIWSQEKCQDHISIEWNSVNVIWICNCVNISMSHQILNCDFALGKGLGFVRLLIRLYIPWEQWELYTNNRLHGPRNQSGPWRLRPRHNLFLLKTCTGSSFSQGKPRFWQRLPKPSEIWPISSLSLWSCSLTPTYTGLFDGLESSGTPSLWAVPSQPSACQQLPQLLSNLQSKASVREAFPHRSVHADSVPALCNCSTPPTTLHSPHSFHLLLLCYVIYLFVYCLPLSLECRLTRAQYLYLCYSLI